MVDWMRHLRRGKNFLSRHDPAAAMKSFQNAVDLCPLERTKDLAHSLFYLGISFQKLGFSSGSIRSWEAASRLIKRGYPNRMLRRFINGYGMPKQSCSEEDDWCAFYSVHLSRYLAARKRSSLVNPAERDMIRDLIREGFERVGCLRRTKGLRTEEKLAFFKSVRLSFPVVMLEGDIIPVDFRRKKLLSSSDHCSCASGLYFGECCGRQAGIDELVNGLF